MKVFILCHFFKQQSKFEVLDMRIILQFLDKNSENGYSGVNGRMDRPIHAEPNEGKKRILEQWCSPGIILCYKLANFLKRRVEFIWSFQLNFVT